MSKLGTALIDARALLKRSELREGMHVADLGCGAIGHHIIPAAQVVGLGGKAYAVDIQKPVLEATKSRAKLEGITNITCVWSDLERVGATRIPAGSLDVAMLISVLHITKQRTEVLKEASRLLSPGGRLVVVDWADGASVFGKASAARITPDDVRDAARLTDLKEREMFEASPYHFGILFVKQ